MEKREAPQMVYKNGRPQGYRVGIGIGGAYGICPFCGGTYEQEDIDNGTVNFEHVFSRFGVKKAIDEDQVFSKIESEFMVAVHKSCNDIGCKDIEKKVSRIIDNFNGNRVQLTKQDAKFLINYCIKISIFLRYLFLWNEIDGKLCYNNEKINTEEDSDLVHGLNSYKNFDVRIRHVDSSAGLYWGLNKVANAGKYCFTIVIRDIEISYFYDAYGYKYEDDNAIFIDTVYNHLLLLLGNEYKNSFLIKKVALRKSVPWALEKTYSSYRMYDHSIKTLSSVYDSMFGLSQNYFIRQKKLSTMPEDKLQKKLKSKKTKDMIAPLDRNIIFCRENQFYFVDNEGILQNLSELPSETEISEICFRKYNITNLPNISELKILKDFVIQDCGLRSLKNSPMHVQGHLSVRNNKLTTLEGGPKYVGSGFYCDYNKLTSLYGSPKDIKGSFICAFNQLSSLRSSTLKNVGKVFDCSNNKLTSLEGAPEEVGEFFNCCHNMLKSFNCSSTKIKGSLYLDAKYLESLDGLPQAKRYIVVDCDEEFDNAKEFISWFKKYKKERNNGNYTKKAQTSQLLIGEKIVRELSEMQNTKNKPKPDDSHGM